MADTMNNDNASKLKEWCAEAYAKYPDSCSHAVRYVIKEAGLKTPKNFDYLNANALLDYFEQNWTNITDDPAKAQRLADQGKIVVAGKKEAGGKNGHVVIVYPGGLKGAGGYKYMYQKLGKELIMEEKGQYPRAMSTSIGSWPGAKSLGEKTVFDSWANEESYRQVKYYTPPDA